MEYQLYNGDCLEVMKNIPDKSVDMILCDLPYGCTKRNQWDIVIPYVPLWEQYKRIVKDNSAIILFGQGMFTAKLMLSNPDMWRYNLVWQKTQPVGFLNANRMPLRSHEDVCVFCKDENKNILNDIYQELVHEDICVFYKKLPIYNPQKTSGHKKKCSTARHKRNSKSSTNYEEYKMYDYSSTERFPTSIVTFAKDIQKEALHPTQKPVALLEWLIKTYTDERAKVLDNCMGSGSTGIACINTNRDFIGIEIEKEMFDIASDRLKKRMQSIL